MRRSQPVEEPPKVPARLRAVPEILQTYDPGHPRWRMSAEADLTILVTEGSPEPLVETVGLEPDKKWAKGDVFGPTRRGRRPYTGISYASRLDGKCSPTEHVSDLVERLRPFVTGIAALSARPTTHGITLWVVEHTRAYDRQIDLDPADLTVIGAMGARLSLDLYVYPDDEE